MGRYIVKFFKNLLSSDGHSFKVLQRATRVQSDNAEDAIRNAQRRFARLEKVPDWRLRADFIESMRDETGRSSRKTGQRLMSSR